MNDKLDATKVIDALDVRMADLETQNAILQVWLEEAQQNGKSNSKS